MKLEKSSTEDASTGYAAPKSTTAQAGFFQIDTCILNILFSFIMVPETIGDNILAVNLCVL